MNTYCVYRGRYCHFRDRQRMDLLSTIVGSLQRPVEAQLAFGGSQDELTCRERFRKRNLQETGSCALGRRQRNGEGCSLGATGGEEMDERQ